MACETTYWAIYLFILDVQQSQSSICVWQWQQLPITLHEVIAFQLQIKRTPFMMSYPQCFNKGGDLDQDAHIYCFATRQATSECMRSKG